MPLGGKAATEVIAALDRHKKYLRTEIAQRINLKFAPEIRFKIDDTFDNVSKIDALLNTDKVKQDLQPRQPAEKEPVEK
jgi:ribosome-binding factor A